MDSFYRRVLADSTGAYQLLCANCNWIKRWDDGAHGGRPVMPPGNAIPGEAISLPA